MKTLIVSNKHKYKAEKIIKTNNHIQGIVGNNVIWEFPNITDMSEFELEKGQHWDIPKESQLETAILELTMLLAGGTA